MKIIITKTFKKDFRDMFFDDRILKVFIKKVNEINLIGLGEDLYKFKFYVKTISIRGVIFININNSYIPVIIAKKSDKNLGENLILNSSLRILLDTKFKKMKLDLENGDYETFC